MAHELWRIADPLRARAARRGRYGTFHRLRYSSVRTRFGRAGAVGARAEGALGSGIGNRLILSRGDPAGGTRKPSQPLHQMRVEVPRQRLRVVLPDRPVQLGGAEDYVVAGSEGRTEEQAVAASGSPE